MQVIDEEQKANVETKKKEIDLEKQRKIQSLEYDNSEKMKQLEIDHNRQMKDLDEKLLKLKNKHKESEAFKKSLSDTINEQESRVQKAMESINSLQKQNENDLKLKEQAQVIRDMTLEQRLSKLESQFETKFDKLESKVEMRSKDSEMKLDKLENTLQRQIDSLIHKFEKYDFKFDSLPKHTASIAPRDSDEILKSLLEEIKEMKKAKASETSIQSQGDQIDQYH